MQNTFAQNKEDKFVLKYLKKGILLEIGSNDGTTFSNSRLLIEKGWSAYLVEPGSPFEQLQSIHKDNHRVRCFNFGIGEKEEVVTFYESGSHVPNGTDRGLVSTTNFEETKRWPDVEFTERKIQLIPFEKFYDYIGKPNLKFISIDVEGLEWSILQQIDLEAVGCKILCIEWNSNPELKNLFTDYCKGYTLEVENAENLIFVKSGMLDKKRFKIIDREIKKYKVPSKIGIGITTKYPDRYIGHMVKSDGIMLFNSDHKTIAQDKNKLIKQLYNLGCEHIFIFDDDCFPIKEGWEEFFIGAAKKHGVDHFVLANDVQFGAGTPICDDLMGYEGGAGCMLFLTRKVVETVGYMNIKYGKYGWEHLGYSWRIFKSGLAPAFGTVLNGWEDYIYSYDLQGADHGFVKEQWQTGKEKDDRSIENTPIFRQEMESGQLYYPYEIPAVPKRERNGKLQVAWMYMYEADAILYYRLSVLKYINSRDIDIYRIPYSGDITWSTFHQYDVLILERPSSMNDLQIIKLAQQAGCKVIIDVDDDLLNVDIMNPTWHIYNQCAELVKQCLCLADEVWVTTSTLKKSFTFYNSNIYVVPNCHNDYQFPVEQKKTFNPKTKKAVWRGMQSHEADVYSVQKELVRIINKNKKWGFNFLGERFVGIQLQCGDNFRPISPMPLLQYFETIHTANPNICFYPLRDNAFNYSKSNIAFLESTYAGAAFFGNTLLPEFNKPFIFDFLELGEMINKPDELQRANEDAWDWIQDNLLLSKINELRVERLLNI